jgi:hypothetical protein
MIKTILASAAIAALAATGPTSCSDKPGPHRQNTSTQDLETFAKCDDDNGHGPVHPCTTRDEDGKWIVHLQGDNDCPFYTVQPKDQVKCVNVVR